MSRQFVVNLLKYLVAVALLGLMIGLNWTSLNKLFRQTPHLQPFLLAATIFTVITLLQYYRWYLLVRAVDLPFTLRNAVRLGLVGTFYNAFLPGSIGGDFVKMYFIARDQPARKAAAAGTVLFDRLVGLFGLILLGAAAGGGFWLAGDPQIGGRVILQRVVIGCGVLSGLAVAGFVLLGLVPEAAADRLGERLAARGRVGHILAELWFAVRTYRRRPAAVAAVVGLSAVVHVGMIMLFYLGVRVFPPADPALLAGLAEHFVIGPIGFIVQALIPLPGGIGGGELTFGGLYKLVRGPDAEAVGLAGRLTLRLVEWTFGLVGYVVFLRMRKELPPE